MSGFSLESSGGLFNTEIHGQVWETCPCAVTVVDQDQEIFLT